VKAETQADSAHQAEPPRNLPPVIGRLLRGTFWLALRTPLQVVFAFWSVPLIIEHIGPGLFGAYGFAWGFGFLQFLLEFGMSSALQRQISDRWTRGDRAGVERSIACGTLFYATTALVQALALIAIARWGVPADFNSQEHALIVRLLWLQALTAPCFGLSTVVSGVLQAARRYDFIPRFELWIVVLRFAVLWAGLTSGVDFFWIVAAQTGISVGLSLGPALWVMTRELGHRPHVRGSTWADVRDLTHISLYMALMQLSVVLADKIDTTILGYALDNPADAIAVYQAISKPFLQIRQVGWMLAYLVMPAVASLAAANDDRALEQIKYDGTRLLVAVVLPVALLAFIDAHPFLAAWVPRFADQSGLMRLFLLSTAPLALSVLVQMAIGLGRIRVIALAALGGSLVNLPLSYIWTRVAGDVSGVIWGTVLTTWVSNGLVPGLYCFRTLGIRPSEFLRRTLLPPLVGAAALVVAAVAAWPIYGWFPEQGSSRLTRAVPLAIHLSIGVLAYAAGYLATSVGRGDMLAFLRRLRRHT
jgi:Na+-driven multidrug efflux pump